MDILLSWSGQSSHDVALALRDWLPDVLPGCTPWVSSEDIAKGDRWSDALHQQLVKTRVTIVCITPDNVSSPWLYYEAGFIAAKLGRAAVCPYLLGVAVKLVTSTPLGLYQCTQADKSDTAKLIRSLHIQLGSPHDPKLVDGNFQAKWQQLKRKLDKLTEGIETVEDEITKTDPPLSQLLSKEAVQLLAAACSSKENRAVIMHIRTMGGVYIQAASKQMIPTDDPRSVALWKGALEELEQFGLIEALSHKREVFEVTRKGWEVFDQLPAIGTDSTI